jgi:spectinomycin phosphotransferase
MLERPDIQDEKIIACLQGEYGLSATQIAFLPLGADVNTAVYRAIAGNETPYFVKLRRGAFDEISVILPKFLSDQDIKQIIAPLPTKLGKLWAGVDEYRVILYPFVAGHDGYEASLSERHWSEFGAALKRIHAAVLPPRMLELTQQETYSPQWRESVKSFLERIETGVFDDLLVINLAAFLQGKRDEILDLVRRTERLAQTLQGQSPQLIVCHSDLHAGNVLITTEGDFYIVDWDNPILAPKERDLMFVGGGLMGKGRRPEDEEALFYQAYGQTRVNPIALAYYRYERIVQDIAAFCEQLFQTNEGHEDREQALRYLKSSFLPNGVLEIAYRSDPTRKIEERYWP